MDLEIVKYNNNAQPYYVIEDSNGKLIVKQPIGYTSKEEFLKFLDEDTSLLEDLAIMHTVPIIPFLKSAFVVIFRKIWLFLR